MGALVGQQHIIAQPVEELHLQGEVDGGQGAVPVEGYHRAPGALHRQVQGRQLQPVKGGELFLLPGVGPDVGLGLLHPGGKGVPDGVCLLILLIGALLPVPADGEIEEEHRRPQRQRRRQDGRQRNPKPNHDTPPFYNL